MQKFKALLLALVLLLCLFPAARGESMYPLPQGQSADGAGVLSQETKEDLSALSALLQKADKETLRQAAAQAGSGNYAQAAQTLQSLMDTPQVQALLKQLGK
jgi:hypothetical protein